MVKAIEVGKDTPGDERSVESIKAEIFDIMVVLEQGMAKKNALLQELQAKLGN